MNRPLCILELCSGTESVSNKFREFGAEVFTIDIEKKFNPSLVMDISKLTEENISQYIPKKFLKPDIIWASPPCKTFSIAGVQYHWTGGEHAYIPKTKQCEDAVELVKNIIRIIELLKPTSWFMENPRGVLRNLPFMKDLPRKTVAYCRYGDFRMKPTDIWTNSENWKPKEMCQNGNPDHESAPRGSRRGTMRLKWFDRIQIPDDLCLSIYQAAILDCEVT